jgi:flagellar protein FlaG
MDITSVRPNIPAAPDRDPVSPQEASERRELIKAVRTVNDHQALGPTSALVFILDPSTRRPVIRVVNPETKEVLIQVPPDYVLRLAEQLKIHSTHADKLF